MEHQNLVVVYQNFGTSKPISDIYIIENKTKNVFKTKYNDKYSNNLSYNLNDIIQ